MQPEDVYMVSLHLTRMVVAQLLLKQLKNSLNKQPYGWMPVHASHCLQLSYPAEAHKICLAAASKVAAKVMAQHTDVNNCVVLAGCAGVQAAAAEL